MFSPGSRWGALRNCVSSTPGTFDGLGASCLQYPHMPTPAYVLDLRRKVGHELLLLPGLVALALREPR